MSYLTSLILDPTGEGEPTERDLVASLADFVAESGFPFPAGRLLRECQIAACYGLNSEPYLLARGKLEHALEHALQGESPCYGIEC